MIKFEDYVDEELVEPMIEYYQWFMENINSKYPAVLGCRKDYPLNSMPVLNEPLLLTRNGDIINVGKAVNGSTHSVFFEKFLDKTLPDFDIYLDSSTITYLGLEFLGATISEKGWEIINPGTAAVDGDPYIALSVIPSKYQRMELVNIMYKLYTTRDGDKRTPQNTGISIHIHMKSDDPNQSGHISYLDYKYDETIPEDIVKKICSAFGPAGFLSEALKAVKGKPITYREWLNLKANVAKKSLQESQYKVGQKLNLVVESIDKNGKAKFKVIK